MMLKVSVDDPHPKQGRRLVTIPLFPKAIIRTYTAELRTADDELVVTRIHTKCGQGNPLRSGMSLLFPRMQTSLSAIAVLALCRRLPDAIQLSVRSYLVLWFCELNGFL